MDVTAIGNKKNKSRFWAGFQVFMIGVSLGAMVGLSSSPIVASVITTILTVVIGSIAVVSVSKLQIPLFKSTNDSPPLAVLAVLTVAIFLGSVGGIHLRNIQSLNYSFRTFKSINETEVDFWMGKGVDSSEVVKAYFERWLKTAPVSSLTKAESESALKSSEAGLDCDRLCWISSTLNEDYKQKILIEELSTTDDRRLDSQYKDYLLDKINLKQLETKVLNICGCS